MGSKSSMAGFGCGCLASVVVLFIVFCIMVALFGALSGGRAVSGGDGPDGAPSFVETWVAGGGAKSPKVARISIKGEIESDGDTSFFSPVREATAKGALERIRYVTDDDSFDGILFEIDSPGGGVTESDELAHAIREFRESDTDRFVLVLMGDMCCSGGYYAAAPADYIMARPTTVTGSIGVMMNGINAAKLAEKLGVESVPIASGANKNMLDPLRPVDPEHIKVLQRPVTKLYDRFVKVVAEGRGLSEETVRRLADGRVFVAEDALEAKLVDGIGYEEDAYDKLCELAGADDVRVYRLDGEGGDLKSLLREIYGACSGVAGGIRSAVRGGGVRAECIFR
ncbi:MAG: signal peptide peptidase SppA [Kiritimatiellae bacterium]|nr:signal peptide peptidase SppA [Kiritimatiellia bacterium]